MKINHLILLFSVVLLGCNHNKAIKVSNLGKAQSTLESVYKHYSVNNTSLLRETFPYSEDYSATYLDNQAQAKPNPYAFLWPYSGSLSAVTAILEANKNDNKYNEILQSRVLPGLAHYYDTNRLPAAFASYINSAAPSDRFYDDNVWLGIDFTDLYLLNSNTEHLDKAKLIWKFIESGTDEKLGGGIYWCEQSKRSKNTCSNAPGSVYALKLYEATKDSAYFKQGLELYQWTKKNLQDTNDFLYYDNINLKGRVEKTKYAYNSGQMLQAAALLYKLTKDKKYLTDAQQIAEACYGYFFTDIETENGKKIKLLKKGNIWFTGIMFRGFVELYHLDGNKTYMKAFQKNLDYAWEHMRDENGLFNSDWSGKTKDNSKWLLTQFAMVEMYARITEFN